MFTAWAALELLVKAALDRVLSGSYLGGRLRLASRIYYPEMCTVAEAKIAGLENCQTNQQF